MDEGMIMDALEKNIGLDYEKIKNAQLKLIIQKSRSLDPKERPSMQDVIDMINGL